MRKNHFGFIEAIGSVVLVLLDPIRSNNKKYLDKKNNTLNRVVGLIVLLVLFVILICLIIKF